MRIGPLVGVVGQAAVLAGLAGTVGVGLGGWLVAMAYAVGTCLALTRGLIRADAAALGPADRVTLARATLVGGVVALTVDSLTRPVSVPVLITLTVLALALDGVDGQVARRTGTVSDLGAQFDMEIDAILLMSLSVYLAGSLGPWALVFGGMRYVFALAVWLLPWMRRQLPPRFWRKVVAAVQGVALVAVPAGVLPGPLASAVLVVSLVLLLESFGRDVLWLVLHRTDGPVPTAARLSAPAARAPSPTTSVPSPAAPANPIPSPVAPATPVPSPVAPAARASALAVTAPAGRNARAAAAAARGSTPAAGRRAPDRRTVAPDGRRSLPVTAGSLSRS
ncbi:CDP-alcohol phosphatidyltransferase family protein [Plantactinospora siamensis]|uniref:CDP-alcohol phosphatidyltransferase family protein n=1 Tax=Plantactinospora siamensis TaxID=555372 RepID=A0ABV6P5L4_9ACTN